MEKAGNRAWIELDRAALARNVALLRSLLPGRCALMAVLKADGYGHGAALLGPALEELGVDAFCTASAGEGAALRRAGVKGEILVLGYTHPEALPLALENGLILTVTGAEHAGALEASGLPLRVHLAVDTGMRRLGFPAEDTAAMEAVFRSETLRAEGAYTHLCTGEKSFCRQQARRFWSAVQALRERGCPVEKAHLLSSAGLLAFPELGGDYARVGIALFGVCGTREDGEACGVPLRPVLSLKTRVAALRELKAGEGAGYGLRWRAERDSRLAALSIGYADGLPRSLSGGRGGALIRSRYAPIAGDICMDQTLVDVTELPPLSVGEEAVLIGRSGGAERSAYDLAEAAGTITNEILSRLGARLERFWS